MFYALLIIVAGCSPTEPEPDLTAILGDGAVEARPADQEALEFDLGSVLARDQTIRHEFALTNHSERPIRLGKVTVKVPCCSSVGRMPDSIPARGEAVVPVLLKAGHISERKRIGFEIDTDSASQPGRTLWLTARFVPAWEVEPVGEVGPAPRLGQAGLRRFRVLCRRKAGEGLRGPSAIASSGPIRVEASGAGSEVEGSDGLIEESREVAVTLAAQAGVGAYHGALLLRWPDGSSRTHEVRWEVRPSLRLTPAAVVLKPSQGPTPTTLTIASDDRPFRILKVAGPLIAGDVALPAGAGLRHTVRVAIDPSRLAAGVGPEIEVVTDHPDQPTVTLGVLVLPPEKGRPE